MDGKIIFLGAVAAVYKRRVCSGVSMSAVFLPHDFAINNFAHN
jgi:hypothetical protein